MDGVDCALIKSDGHTAQALFKAVHISYSPDLRLEISQAMEEAASLGHPSKQNLKINCLEEKLTDIHAQAVNQILKANNLSHKDITIVGFHGQTLLHKPNDGWTWQIGDGQLLANKVQIPVVNDFRRNDVESGGQGAPLVPIYHQSLIKALAKPEYPVAIVNIGGVSNITWIGSDSEGRMLAFDTGPGNALLDDWVKQHTGDPMDRNGILAAKGNIDHALLEQWLHNSYFFKTPPKSLDRHAFSINGIEKLSLEDGAATLLEFTIKTIEIALSHCPESPKHIYICGGGRHNDTLMLNLRKLDIPVSSVEELGWNGDFLEAEAFAFLACRNFIDLPITFPGTTGIDQSSPGGKLYKPELIA